MQKLTLSRPIKIAALCIIAAAVCAVTAMLIRDVEPYATYQQPWLSNNDLSIQAIDSQYYGEIESELRRALKEVEQPKERAILAGMHWLLGFADDDANFTDVFTDLVLALHELTYTKLSSIRAELGRELVVISLLRALPKLNELFEPTEAGRWDFISLLPMLNDYPELEPGYHEFYQKWFSGLRDTSYQHPDGSFADALQAQDYAVIGDYLIDVSFLHYYLQQVSNSSLRLPPDTFPELLQQLTQFDYALPPPEQVDDYFDLAYLATHVILVKTNYGELELTKDDPNTERVAQYFDKTYRRVRFELGDLDLLAEYLQCLRLLSGSAQDPRIPELEAFILSLQRSDGSWGRRDDFSGDPYEQFHPTWAVLSALNEESSGMQ